jgi:shikimate dehydrogenase
MHNAAIAALGLDAVYVAARTTPRAFPGLVHSLLEAGGGLNVTSPFKDQAAAIVDQPSDAVRLTQACNTIWGAPDNASGDNTDIAGTRAAVRELMAGRAVQTARLHGTGGSARAVAIGLRDEYPGVAIEVVSRTSESAAAFVAWALGVGVTAEESGPVYERYVDLAINCTPSSDTLTVRPQDECKDPEFNPARPGAFLDLTYRKGETSLVRVFRVLGVPAMDGRAFLVAQGVAAFERFFGVQPPIEVMRAAVDDALRA